MQTAQPLNSQLMHMVAQDAKGSGELRAKGPIKKKGPNESPKTTRPDDA